MAKSKSIPARNNIIGTPDGVRRSPRGKSKTVPGGEKEDGRKKASNKTRTVDPNKTTKARKPVGDEEMVRGKRKKPVGDKEPAARGKEPPAKRRPNIVRRTKGTGRNTPPVEVTEYDVLLTPEREERDDNNVDEGEDDDSNDHPEEDDEEAGDDKDDDDEGAAGEVEDDDENAGDEEDDNDDAGDEEDEEYGDDDEEDDDDDDNVEEASEEQDEEAWDDDEGKTADRRGTTASFSHRKFREYLEGMNSEKGVAKKPRKGAVDRTGLKTKSQSVKVTSSSIVETDTLLVHVMTRKESMRSREQHVTSRVRAFVKNQVFRMIKFVNNDSMIQKAMSLVMDFENVPKSHRLNFHILYESVFNEALNSKRSSCEQAARKIVIPALKKMDADEFFTIKELCKLRRSTTEKEKEAFYWFFGSFLECVCGKKAWGKAKYVSLVSLACETNRTAAKLVTMSDEAFALLIFDNYIDKWIEISEEEKEQEDTEGNEDNQNKKMMAARRIEVVEEEKEQEPEGDGDNQTTTKKERRRGKYTGASEKS